MAKNDFTFLEKSLCRIYTCDSSYRTLKMWWYQ